ncbi:MAG TPA: glycosyltransferase family 4 protein [Flavobacteriales bacterium]|nr:glycosyltransferase family 4 protein [Flavobacteriales bacterium]
MKIIGTNSTGYPQTRNFHGLPFLKYRVEKKYNLYKIPEFIYFKFASSSNFKISNSFSDLDIHNVEMYHFFNALSYGKTPWVTTFETSLPRWGNKNTRKGLELIAGASCKKIIALSNCSADIQRAYVTKNASELLATIEEKLMVLHPPQVCPPIETIKKGAQDKLVFTIVGSDFFRKGGKEVLTAFDRLYKNGTTDWHLNIVSKLHYGDYASRSTLNDLEFVKKIISGYPDHITHHTSLPNPEVLELFRKTHIALLPTYADTYGYSALEAQSYGCPVISTNIRALPEINNSDIGWCIDVKKNELGNAILKTENDLISFSDHLTDELERTLRGIFDHPEDIAVKGLKSFKKLEHSISNNTKVLEQLYDEITGTGKS